MPDNLPGRSKDEGAGRALTRVEFEKRERARKALELWKDGASYAQIKNALRLRSADEARKQVEAGEEMWRTEELAATTRYQALMTDDMMEARRLLMDSIREGHLGNVDKLDKVWTRMARLRGLDAEREDTNTGPQITVVNTTPPWLKGDVVDSTATDDKEAPKGLPG